MSESDTIYLALVPVLDTSRPNFKSAGWRVFEAGERLREIVRRIPDLGSEWRGYPVVRAPKSTPAELQISVQEWQWSHMPTARALTLLASEVLHHARIALDYCAYHAVWLDSGTPRPDTKFPLVGDRGRWSKERRKSLPGLTVEHLEWVHDVQPFLGVKWASDLLELSNRDKHRMAVEVVPTYRCRVDQRKRFADPLGDRDYWGFAVDDAMLELQISPAMGRGATEATGLPLEETLMNILRGTTILVNRFLVAAGFSKVELQVDGQSAL